MGPARLEMAHRSSNGPMVLTLCGDHHAMGRQHGEQVRAHRERIHEAVRARLAEADGHPRKDAHFQTLVRETRRVLQQYSSASAAFVRGQAEALDLEPDVLLRYALVSYVRDDLLTRAAHGAEACTTWAATGSATADGQAILAKNRDYGPEHLPLQTVSFIQPSDGYGYVSVGSAASPAVYCGGINEAGLAVADTHVTSRSIGPGLPDFVLMMEVLEHKRTVRGAVDYIRSVPRLGRNNLVLADAQGETAVFESGHTAFALFSTRRGALVNTNHRISPLLRKDVVDLEPPKVRGNSLRRYERVSKALEANDGAIDVDFAQDLMASHDPPLGSVCRHPLEGCESQTIAGCIFVPAERTLLFCHGLPCQGTYQTFDLNKGGDER